ncbi:MAG: glycosyltransferase [Silicimonas sp.]|nr:glycosyltransferase [Silicimonas sp.]NND19665.1 glycosyltransferase [Silicimonas sp.]RZW12727.1 MAG: glycosyltransferase [Paracoccaceae bacterium]
MTVAAVVIGRNEGARLVRCLTSLKDKVAQMVYVDSGSVDGSIEAAQKLGAAVVELDMALPFTAARARNSGLARFSDAGIEYVQVIDGDCEIRDGWIEAAVAFLDAHPDVAIVAGRLRERRPDATVWNRLAHSEWNQPPGETDAVAGTAVLRLAAIREVDGYCDQLIAGEEPEMCLRLRKKGWRIWRLDREMALHDIDMTQFRQWWRRTQRGGHAFAEGAVLHFGEPEKYRIRETLKALVWGALLPAAAVFGAIFISPWALLLLLAWPLQVLRLTFLRGLPLDQSFFLTLSKLPEAQGIILYARDRLIGRRRGLIEYKLPASPSGQ